MALFEGDFQGKAVGPEIGMNGGKYVVRWNMEVVGGPRDGQQARYSGKLDADHIKYTKRDMIAIGWKGKDVATFVDDVKAAALVVPFRAEIASNTYADTGKTSQWTSARSIGFAAKPLDQLDSEAAARANKWFANVGDAGSPPPSKPAGQDDDLPF